MMEADQNYNKSKFHLLAYANLLTVAAKSNVTVDCRRMNRQDVDREVVI